MTASHHSTPGAGILRFVVKTDSMDALGAHLRAYGEMYHGGSTPQQITVSGPTDGWVEVRLPPNLPTWHLHNLAKWVEGGAPGFEAPEQFMVVSRGVHGFDYWLSSPAVGADSDWLAGATANGRALQVHCPSGDVKDDPKVRVPPLTLSLALMRHGVPASLHREERPPAVVTTVTLHLADDMPQEMKIPEAANLADGFQRTESKSAFARAADAFFGIFRIGRRR